MVEDPALARQLKELILRDMAPENSWVIAKREKPLDEAQVTRMLDVRSVDRSRMDLWPARYTTSYEKQPAATAVLPEHPHFYEYYRDAGVFPGADEGLCFKEILTHLLTTLNGLSMPLL